MIKIEDIEVFGWKAALRGMRNPMNSWAKSDSEITATTVTLGPNDLKLARMLAANGTDDGKFLRMIHVQADITAPLYWWKEYDTYKVGTVANSCSTMHKIHAKDFTLEDFSHEHLTASGLYTLKQVINDLNSARHWFVQTSQSQNVVELNSKDYWWDMIQLLPTSFNQKRTVDLNYAVLRNMYHARKNHKLDEWHEFCRCVEALPYAELITAVHEPKQS